MRKVIRVVVRHHALVGAVDSFGLLVFSDLRCYRDI